MSKLKTDSEQERLEILRQYKRLIEVWYTRKDTKDKWLVRKAFRLAADAHKDMRRKSGEPFILHPIEVAIIAAKEIGLGRTSIISALLHDTVEDTYMTLEDIEGIFGSEVSKIIDGLTKINVISVASTTAQAETIKKILFTLSDDVRVILIKLADRIHNMRTLDSIPSEKQLRVVSETQYIYAPLAYRLGLYKIKSELEELSFKFSQPKVYAEIANKIDLTSENRLHSFNAICTSISSELQKLNYKFEIKLNVKSAYSFWQKMREQKVSFEDIYNTYSIDVILEADPSNEKLICWSAYSIITGIYRSNSKRLRDWISTPKANGYEAIHTTIMNPFGEWVDLHIRSTRMDEIANKGYAAYWKYKDNSSIDSSLDNWLKNTRLLISESDEDAFDFITEFKSNLLSDEIYVFTPAGKMYNMPSGATVLDFAYTIHTDLGNQCIGANIRHRIVSLGHKIKSGDQVEIITSKIQTPNEDWYKYVVTARAKSRIADSIKNNRKQYKKIGEEKLDYYFKQLNVENTKHNLYLLLSGSNIKGHIDLYFYIAQNMIGLKEIKEIMQPNESRLSWIKNLKLPFTKPKIVSHSVDNKDEVKTLNGLEEKKYKSDFSTLEHSVSECCNPIPGDNVIGLIFPNEPIQIHLTDCKVAIRLMSQHGKNIVKAKWKQKAGITFLAGLNIKAADNIGLINEIITPITVEFNINIRSVNLKSSEGLANMDITVYVSSTKDLKKLMARLEKIKSIIKVSRLEKI
ncbi:MAG: bifunctional (p)ppGpp synthetase/guanosine-3',5'-bis(diphosphate) 3'-pyrophosphohydrolase [Bacteroidetes bacterium]|nr:bifunctional (p)ppGpp synthetase/guanosine-3',5'-bis(diphosphate) 3'-pyrophosphohydrolase [Bacteroidota bacterium]MBL6944060.1 bifunctional (p)ppGpp synthetase/guanosine-3',5'-bis(diphosphate) 3'-pyrophosphohydrolase [Bacteroidales bacterium]